MSGTMQTVRVGGVPGGYPAEIDATVKVRFVEDSEIVNMSDLSTDFLKLVGGVNQFQFDNEKNEWTEHDTWSRRPTITAVGTMEGTGAGAADADTDTLTIAAQAYRYPIGTIFVNLDRGNELVRLESHTDVNDVVVRRGYAGTSLVAADWTTADRLQVAGSSMHENDSWLFRPSYILGMPYNIHQIQHGALKQTWHRAGVRLYGSQTGANDFAEQVAQTMAEHLVAVEEAIIFGQRFVGSANEPSTAGGLDYFINLAGSGATVTDIASGSLTRKDIEDTAQTIAYAVGRQNAANLFICDYWCMRKVRDFFDAKERLDPDTSIAGLELERIRIPGLGIVSFLPHTACPTGRAYLVKLERIRVGTFAGLGQPHIGEVIQNAGPHQARYFYMNWGAEFKGMAGFGELKDFSTTS